ncbi:CoA pyrophosphatase [Sporosarcina aquimarina]|uniref:NUDIX hydrolase n=1 Tax=Sporosarcina aquimarina TaxID=114975 RepID=UPI00203BC111|nr:CoA pyrophosphatase [Sporosarcina aquimarina]MCM3758003.1 CoA pyrophosphatase [Sporosarcina aquimarina]
MFLEDWKKQLNDNKSLFIGEDTAFRAAVLVPLVQESGEWHVVFERRSLTMRKQPGDSSFPGGRIDSTDASPMDAALRETHEELGIDPDTVTVIGKLSPYIASPSFVVYPFVAVCDYHEIIHSFNKDEVEEVFAIPLKWLLDHEPVLHRVPVQPIPLPDFPFDKIYNGEQYQWGNRSQEEWFYEYEEYIVWGLTARILKHFIDLIK